MDKTTWYYYDGVNEIVETDEDGYNQQTFIHGISYIDERLMMRSFIRSPSHYGPYYYVLDRMYNVRFLLDCAGAIIERYCYDAYGRPLIRECAGRGDMTGDSRFLIANDSRFDAAKAGTIWDARADMDNDGDVDAADETLYDAKEQNWPPDTQPTVSEAFSDVGNPFMHQGWPHFALDTASKAAAKRKILDQDC